MAPGADAARVDGGLRAPARAMVARARRCVRIWSITGGCAMKATIPMTLWHVGHTSGSTSKSCWRSAARRARKGSLAHAGGEDHAEYRLRGDDLPCPSPEEPIGGEPTNHIVAPMLSGICRQADERRGEISPAGARMWVSGAGSLHVWIRRTSVMPTGSAG